MADIGVSSRNGLASKISKVGLVTDKKCSGPVMDNLIPDKLHHLSAEQLTGSNSKLTRASGPDLGCLCII